MSELQLKEVREVVRKARASSAPGPSGTSYKVYKYCPKLLLRLWYILQVFWRRGWIPDQWRVAEGVWIPKEENSTQLDQFRIISLLCVEAKVFFSAVSKRLCTYLAENTYIDTSFQTVAKNKGGISGMPGCLQHTGVVTQLIREARDNKGNLSVLWLDLENAFGSIPHKLVQFTLTKHHVPSRCRDLIADYYSNFRMRVSSGAIKSSWHKVEIGIITGCTISVTLFSLAMNMLTKSAEPECRGPRMNSGQRQPPIRAFMDDLTVMTESVPGCRWILKGLEELVEWARMRFKPAKSRSMVLRKGKLVDKFRFNIADTAIPSISEKPVKSLGKVFDCSLRDTTSIQSTCTELDGWLKSVDKSGLPGKFKAWVYQHGILPRILWPLLVYAVPISTVETLERRPLSKHRTKRSNEAIAGIKDIPSTVPTVKDIPSTVPTVKDIPSTVLTVKDIPSTVPTVKDIPSTVPLSDSGVEMKTCICVVWFLGVEMKTCICVVWFLGVEMKTCICVVWFLGVEMKTCICVVWFLGVEMKTCICVVWFLGVEMKTCICVVWFLGVEMKTCICVVWFLGVEMKTCICVVWFLGVEMKTCICVVWFLGVEMKTCICVVWFL
ncbi:hypothetical protein NHX12_027442, partial [Muraenolepis orangiensis]